MRLEAATAQGGSMGFAILWILLCVGVTWLADSRGRSAFGFFLLSLFFSPLLGLIVVLVIPDLVKQAEAEALRQREQDQREKNQRAEHERQLESIRAISAAATAAPPVAAVRSVPVTRTVSDELEKLAGLRDRGILTEDEFQSQKAALLAAKA